MKRKMRWTKDGKCLGYNREMNAEEKEYDRIFTLAMHNPKMRFCRSVSDMPGVPEIANGERFLKLFQQKNDEEFAKVFPDGLVEWKPGDLISLMEQAKQIEKIEPQMMKWVLQWKELK